VSGTGASSAARTLVVAASAAARSQIVRVLEADADIVVVGEAASGAEAVQRAVELGPDLVIVDLYLPDGGGRPAIEQIMARVPTPILVLSRNSEDHRSPSVVEALVAGALDALPQPSRWTPDLAAQLCRSVRVLRKVPVMRVPEGSRQPAGVTSAPSTSAAAHQTVAIAASAGDRAPSASCWQASAACRPRSWSFSTFIPSSRPG
jgi:two-component system chemotaxis response regulator CheB